jgi:hypothetical protein
MSKLLQRRVIVLPHLVKTMTEVRRKGKHSCWVASAACLLNISRVAMAALVFANNAYSRRLRVE